jgi:hypothetical protein
MNGDAEEYRKRAKSCLKVIAALTREDLKLEMLGMVGAWLRLAEQAERNRGTGVIYEPPEPSQSN